MTHDRLRVRPPGEPVPGVLVGTAAGDVLSWMVRMNDGASHAAPKREAAAGAGPLRLPQMDELGLFMARELHPAECPNEWLGQLPVGVMAAALAVGHERPGEIA